METAHRYESALRKDFYNEEKEKRNKLGKIYFVCYFKIELALDT